MFTPKMDWNFASSNGCYNQANALVAAANILSIPALAAIATSYPSLPSFAHLTNNNDSTNNQTNNNNNNQNNNFAHVLQQLPFNTTRINSINPMNEKSIKNTNETTKIENSSSNNKYDDKYSDCESNYGKLIIFIETFKY
jgi:hypothetical protein